MRIIKNKFVLSLFVLLLAGGVYSSRAGRFGKRAELTSGQQAILEKLPDEDREEYFTMRTMFETGRSKSFSANFDILEGFINRRPENVNERSYLVGYFPLDGCTFISNLKYLQSTLGRSKSNLCGEFSRLGYKFKYSIEYFKYSKCEQAVLIRRTADWRQWVIRRRNPVVMMVNIIFQPVVLLQPGSVNTAEQQNLGNPSANDVHNDNSVKLEEYRLNDHVNMINFEASKYGQLNMQEEFAKNNDIVVDDSNSEQTVVDFSAPKSPSSEPLPNVCSSGV